MSEHRSADSVASFIAIVERDRDQRCEEILAAARTAAGELVSGARREAKERVGKAAREARARARDRIEGARADLSTRDRRVAHEVARALLDRGFARLESALRARWEEPRLRASWIEGAIADAARLLPPGQWEVEHPASLDEATRVELDASVARASGSAPKLSPSAEIQSGIRLRSSGACFDASARGLLADRTSVEGRLLLELSRHKGAGP